MSSSDVELGSSADVESGASVNEQRLPASGGVRLLDREIEDLWKFTFRNQPCPSRVDEDNRWKLLKLAEKFWEEEVTETTARLNTIHGDFSAIFNELYQIVGFYSVFQVLLIGAASQSDKLSCRERGPLFVLCAIITVFALVGIYLKFGQYQEIVRYADLQQRRRNQRAAQITRLRRQNIHFEFPAPMLHVEPSKIRMFIIRFIPVFVILAFSVAIIVCINWILCPSEY